jgi:hypothetical protein
MMSRRPDVRPTFDELVEKLDGISKRLGGRIPPRNIDVELIKSQVTDVSKQQDGEDEDGGGRRGLSQRTVAVAVAAGIAIGVGVSLAVIMAMG